MRKELSGGGPGTSFPIDIPLFRYSESLGYPCTMCRLKRPYRKMQNGTLNGGDWGGCKKSRPWSPWLSESLPEGSLPAGLTPAVILSLLDTLLVLDVDTNGDGTNESIFHGFPFEAIPEIWLEPFEVS